MTDNPAGSGRVLFVCTANVCRSPVAELVLRDALRQRGVTTVDVQSAGLRPLTGHPLDPVMAGLLQAQGIDGSGHRAEPIRPELLDSADLVLTATLAQRSELVRQWPAALPKTFTLGEFVALAANLPERPDGLGSLLSQVRDQRALRPVAQPGMDIADPYHRSRSVYRRCFRQLGAGVLPLADVLAAALAGPDRSSSPLDSRH